MNTVYLVRHGENVANLTLELSSRRVDYALTEKGRLQAAQTGEHFRGMGIDQIYASPLKRAVETAQIIGAALGLTPVVLENFREVDVGDLELQPASAESWRAYNRVVMDWAAGKPESGFPNGDCYHSLWRRYREGLRLAADGKNGRKIMIVAHGGIFSSTLKDLCPVVDAMLPFKSISANCSVTEVELEINAGTPRGRLVTWASHAHLHGAAADLVRGVPGDGEL